MEYIERDDEPYLFSIDYSAISSISASSPFLGGAINIDYPYMSREYMPSILGSAHGLVCIDTYPSDICVWNPTTREYKPIPVPSSYSKPYYCHAHGFGFDCKNDDYKMEDRDICTHIDVWAMADNKWSKHLEITAHVTDMYFGSPFQTSQNGDILFEGGPETEERGRCLISYDPNLERVRAHIQGFPYGCDVETYIETLIALKSGTYVGQEQKKKQRRKRRNRKY
ncbi:F-box protein CPR1-like [Papaver somniferum]|uniref:F-box protein CPR1-like n=1 Tax=Papaver somniferum TaxID=3469 RepID=UPI000E6F63D8|nr:F-box protein CPR1-like [Papaver somniferum]